MTLDRFHNLFPQRKAIIGMLHLSGNHPVERALEELTIYEEEGLAGAIVENYHNTPYAVECVLEAIKRRKSSIAIGVNILPNRFPLAYDLAKEHGASFIQMDYIAGKYEEGALPINMYNPIRDNNPEIVVLGGVWPKYYHPLPTSNMQEDIRTGKSRADALVVTGAGTGKETPMEKILTFRKHIGENYPLIIGAGLTPENVKEQLRYAQGAIVGSTFKPEGDTQRTVDPTLVRQFMNAANDE